MPRSPDAVAETPSRTAPQAPASIVRLPDGPWATVLDALAARFLRVPRDIWADRLTRGCVEDVHEGALDTGSPHVAGRWVRYRREVADEPRIPFEEVLVHVDEHLVVVDKPHFLAVMPAGRHARETLVARLEHRLAVRGLTPLHRLDRATAGLVLLSRQPASRAAYQALFRERRIRKTYHALAPPLPGTPFPQVRRTRLLPGEPFHRMREADGEANTETEIQVLERGAVCWLYGLVPTTGRKHQLRVHMAALGAPILGDDLYPELQSRAPHDFSSPLQLLARRLEFDDPLTGERRSFESRAVLAPR